MDRSEKHYKFKKKKKARTKHTAQLDLKEILETSKLQ